MRLFCGSPGLYFARYFLSVGIPSLGSILVYMDSASAVNIFVPGGNLLCWRSYVITS